MNLFAWKTVALIGVIVLVAWAPALPAQDGDSPLLAWRFYVDELAIESQLLYQPDNPLQPEPLALRNVTVIDLPEGVFAQCARARRQPG